LTGVRLLLWDECRKHFYVFATLIMFGVAWWGIASRFRTVLPLAECLRWAAALPFSDATPHITEPFIFSILMFITPVTDSWMAARIRQLRTLPLSSTRLGSLPVVMGLASASMLFLVLLAVHGLVLRRLPVSLRPDLFFAFGGMTALIQAIRFVNPMRSHLRDMVGLVPLGIVFGGFAYFADDWKRMPDAAGTWMLMGGLAALAVSWTVMRYSLRHSSAMYRPRTPAVA
jgi:hypothetical protein